jgi:ADP-ribose pyrophosphatase
MADRDDAGGPWRKVDSRTVWQTPFLSVREDTVALPEGGTTPYGVIECGHCVGVLPFLDPQHVVMIRQYRYIPQRFTWEMPTGGVHAGESVEAAAQRELAEESGYRAAQLRPVSTYHTSKSSIDETAHLFVGTGLTPDDEAEPDATERIERRVLPFDDVLARVLGGEITDSMTVIAVLLADRERRLG